MSITRWMAPVVPWNEMRRFREEMGRLFESLGQEWPALAASFPLLKVWLDDNNVYLEAELPGMDLSDLEIYVTRGDQLTIKGERKPPQVEKATWRRQERGFGAFTRVLTLPVPVDADKVEAHLANGILTIRLPKSETARPKRIPVKAE
jgi:HSP20 family protein